MKNTFLSLAVFAAVLLGGHVVNAANQTVSVNMEFATPLTFTVVSNIDFGVVAAGAGDTYTIDTTGAVTAGTPANILGGTKTAGNVTIIGSGTQTIDITVTPGAAAGGVTPQNPVCRYNAGAIGSCSITGAAAPDTGKTLLIGIEAVVDGTQASGATAAPTITVGVNYS